MKPSRGEDSSESVLIVWDTDAICEFVSGSQHVSRVVVTQPSRYLWRPLALMVPGSGCRR